jgi:ubiquinone/menaquinone biosynthesis C-methylase UbiE
MLEVLRQRIQAAHLRNVTPVLALDGDPLLPDATCDVALVIDTHHHFPDAAAYLRRLARTLKKGGRIVEIDYHKRELPVGPDPEHKVAREQVLRDAEAAGLVLAGELTFLPYQYFLVFKAPR